MQLKASEVREESLNQRRKEYKKLYKKLLKDFKVVQENNSKLVSDLESVIESNKLLEKQLMQSTKRLESLTTDAQKERLKIQHLE